MYTECFTPLPPAVLLYSTALHKSAFPSLPDFPLLLLLGRYEIVRVYCVCACVCVCACACVSFSMWIFMFSHFLAEVRVLVLIGQMKTCT